MRLFVAIDLPDSVKDAVDSLRRDIPGAVWVKRHAFHLTLRFLGDDIDPTSLSYIQDALKLVSGVPFEMRLRSVGRFPKKGAARVLWAGVDAPPELITLYKSLDTALSEIGFPPPDNPFSPHITIARMKNQKGADDVNAFLLQNAGFVSDYIPVSQFILYSSKLTESGSEYTVEQEISLDD